MATVSIIIPVYNVAEWLDRCLLSVTTQTHVDLDIILINDGSTDSSPAKCDEWGQRDNRIRVIHQQNGGPSRARNTGLELMRGEYVTFVDSDDWISRDLVRTLLRDSRQTSSVAIANFSRTAGSVEPRTPEPQLSQTVSRQEAIARLLGADHTLMTVACGKLYSRDIFRELRFAEGRLHEDEFIAHQVLLSAAHISINPTPLYFYFSRDTSIMGSPYTQTRGRDSIDADRSRAEDLLTEGYYDLAEVAWQQLVRRVIKVLCWAVQEQQPRFRNQLVSELQDLRADSRWMNLPLNRRLLGGIALKFPTLACLLLRGRSAMSRYFR